MKYNGTEAPWCRLCEWLTRNEAFRYHELHGEDHCKWSEQGRFEEELIKGRVILDD